VLIIDADRERAASLAATLEQAGYVAVTVGSSGEGLRATHRLDPGIVLVDLALPDHGGLEVCRRLRGGFDAGVIALSARADEAEAVRAFEAGADDFVGTPLRPRELVARVAALARRTGAVTPPEATIEVGDLVVDARRHEVRLAGRDVHATRREFQLLQALAAEAGRAFSLDGVGYRLAEPRAPHGTAPRHSATD
jgi:two-component system response regulator ParR